MQLVYNIKDKPGFGKTLIFAFQQVLAILAATIAVPAIVGNGMSQPAALFGAGVGTIVYQLFTRFKSPVFLGSSFAFIGSMFAAFSGGVSMQLGYLGLLIGAAFAALVYVVLAIVVKIAGVNWIDRLMPAAVIGPTVAIIGLSLAGNAVKDAVGFNAGAVEINSDAAYVMTPKGWICLACALITLIVVVLTSVYGKKMMKLIPFIIGILAGYAAAAIFTVIGLKTGNADLQIINFGLFKSMQWIPDFTFLKAFDGFKELTAARVGMIAVAYVPVAFVVFAEHLADHKNLSSIIEKDLLKEPGLHNTLLGDGVGSFCGAFFGGCPNTTYGESIGCVAITKNASIITITTTAILCLVAAFVAPFTTFLATIPGCVMGGVCITLYGFIACSGLKMIQKVNLDENHNLFVVATILITGIGGMALQIGEVKLTSIACALILGIIVNLVCSKAAKKDNKAE